MNTTFTAIDFETAQGYRWSICQVGLVRVVNGSVVAKLDLLVKPPHNYYWKDFTDIHGISEETTLYAPTFNEVWPLMKPYIDGQLVVAHNSKFDFGCLNATLEFYRMDQPNFNGDCTFKVFGKGLKNLCVEHNIPLNHHEALSDAMACAELYLMHGRALLARDQNNN